MRIGAALLAATVLCVPTNAQAPGDDVTGWRGAEWGMTPGQVAAAIGVPLGEPQFYEKVVATLTCVNVRDYPFGNWSPDVFACFDDGPPGLSSISLTFDPVEHVFTAVLDALTSCYGPAARTTREQLTGIVHEEAMWLFPSTEIRASRMEVPGPSGARVLQSVTYRRRGASAF